jgi:hypothetical protein
MPRVPCQRAARPERKAVGVAGGLEEVRGAKILIAGIRPVDADDPEPRAFVTLTDPHDMR